MFQSHPHNSTLLVLVPLPLSLLSSLAATTGSHRSMAHRATTHRRNSALPDPKPFPPHRTTSHRPSPNQDPSLPFTTKRVNPIHRPTSPPPPPPPAAAADVRLLTKSLSVSAIFDSLSKPNRQPRETHKSAKPSSKTKSVKEFPDFRKPARDKELKVDSALGMRKLSASVDGGRRRSVGSAQVDVADFLANNGARIVSVDMPPFMQIHAVDFARKTHDSLEKFTARTLASTLKKEFDGVYGPAWHCIVGTSFGSFVTHSVGGFMYFSLDQKMYILLFKTTVQRAD